MRLICDLKNVTIVCYFLISLFKFHAQCKRLYTYFIFIYTLTFLFLHKRIPGLSRGVIQYVSVHAACRLHDHCGVHHINLILHLRELID